MIKPIGQQEPNKRINSTSAQVKSSLKASKSTMQSRKSEGRVLKERETWQENSKKPDREKLTSSRARLPLRKTPAKLYRNPLWF